MWVIQGVNGESNAIFRHFNYFQELDYLLTVRLRGSNVCINISDLFVPIAYLHHLKGNISTQSVRVV